MPAGIRLIRVRGDAQRCHPPELVAARFGEPQVPIGAGGDPIWLTTRRRDRELGESARGRPASDLVAAGFREPQACTGASGGSSETTTRRRELRNRSLVGGRCWSDAYQAKK